MAELNLSGQQTAYNQIAPRIQTLKTEMDKRATVWQRLPDAEKKTWVLSPKDPIMGLAWNVYTYLRDNFFERVGE